MKKSKVVLLLSGMMSLAFLSYILYLTRDLNRSEKKLIESPNVLDVTSLIQTKLLVSKQDLQGTDWTGIGWNDQSWKSITVPEHRIVKEPEFREGSFAYYRILVPTQAFQSLSNLENELFLAPQYIHFHKLDIFVNGVLYRTNTPRSYPEAIVTVPLDHTRDNLVAIKGYVKSGDSGINHRGKILLGKGAELNELHRKSYKGVTVNSLIYILSKGSVYFVFFLIFLLMKVEKYFEKFLLYGFFVISEDILVGEYGSNLLSLNHQVYLFNLVNLGIVLFLFLFLSDVLLKKQKKSVLITVFGSCTAIAYLISVDLLHTSYVFNINHILMFWNLAMMGVLSFFLPQVFKVDRVLFAFILVAFALIGWSTFFSSNIGFNLKLPANLIIFFMVAYQTFVLFRREQVLLQTNQRLLLEQEKDVAIGKTAALLAHDVRKPLEHMSYILKQIGSGNSSKDFLEVAKRDVDISLANVTNQINDIMNYSRTRELKLEPISFYRILASAIKQVMAVNNNLELELKYDFKARSKVLGDDSRLSSVLTNLISNSVEAIRDIGQRSSGVIGFSSRMEEGLFVFTIFNDGPLIPNEVLPEIFKPLFTHGKNKGTGLGLASVSKIIRDHKGVIEARNIEGHGVEFKLSLQLANEADVVDQNQFFSRLDSYHLKKSDRSDVQVFQPLRLFILDDDVQVYEYFKVITKGLPFTVNIGFAVDWLSGVKLIQEKRFDLYLLDFDIGSGKTGLDFYNEHLRFLSSEVILHSNRDKDFFLNLELRHEAKPISESTLRQICTQEYARRQKVLMIDDSELSIMAWELYHGRHNFTGASSPEDALKLLLDPGSDFDICVIDYYFDNSKMNGVELAGKIREMKPKMKILVASNAELDLKDVKVIEKNHFEIRSLI